MNKMFEEERILKGLFLERLNRKEVDDRRTDRFMNFGFLILAIAFLLTATAVSHQGWWWLLLWPAFSFGVVAAGYFYLGPRVFGKSERGLLAPLNRLILLPYLLYLNGIWYLLRLVRPEPAINALTETIFISRRLLSNELPVQIEHVIDLTCEFSEPEALRSGGYDCFPVLDRAVPTVEDLRIWIEKTAALEGPLLIHCAEGHGRTGVFALALLIYTGHSKTPEAALQFIQSKRPLVRLSREQWRIVQEFSKTI